MEQRVCVRAAQPSDAAAIQAVYAPFVAATVVSFEQTPPPVEVMLQRMLARPRLPWLVACRADEVVGYSYATVHRARPAYRWAVDCSIYLGADARGQGTGQRLYERLLSTLRALGYVSAYAGITLPNPASVGLHEAMGFRPVGVFVRVGFKHGGWHDVGWWQCDLAGPLVEPPEPAEWAPGSAQDVDRPGGDQADREQRDE